jgi:PAS domain S-box-containing protein
MLIPEQYWSFTLASIGDGVVSTDVQGNIQFMNPAAAQLTGWSADEADGVSIQEVLRFTDNTGTQMNLLEITKEISGRSSVGLKKNTTFIDKSGESKYVSASIAAIHDEQGAFTGSVVVFRDITELRKMEEELLHERNHLKAFFEIAPVGIIVVDKSFEFVKFNDTATGMLGSQPKMFSRLFEYFPCNCGQLYTESCDSCRFRETLKQVYKTGVPVRDMQLPLMTLDNGIPTRTWFRINAVPITLQSKLLMLTLDDITAHKQAEEEMIRAKELAEAANKAKGQFLANMSHEIRTPLNGMLGMIDLTLQKELSWEQKENLSIAKNCANSLLKVINDILDFSKIEAGKLRIDRVEFDVRKLMDKSLRPYAVLSGEKGIDFTYEVAPDVPTVVLGDPERLQQIIGNLTGNAVKFTEKGKIHITVKRLRIEGSQVVLLFDVSDTGIGITDKEKSLLFKSFSQVDGSYTREFGGTGLGLAISKQLTEMMGGTIWVEGEKGKGSTFSFTTKLFLYDPVLTSLQMAQVTTKLDSKVKILLVEDDKINQTVTFRFLTDMGHHVYIANNGKEAIEAWERHQFDIILMDIQMPIMDGMTAIRWIRDKERMTGEHLPIIALTAHALMEDQKRFLGAGADECIFKPVQMQELMQAIDRLVSDEFDTKLEKAESVEAVDTGSVLNEIYSRILELRAIIRSEDYDVIEKKAHGIKELSASIGMDSVKTVAFKLELAARKGKRTAIDESFQLIETSFQKISH